MKDLKHLIYFENLLQEANNELVQQAKAEGEHALGYTCYFVPETLLNLPGCFSSRLRAPNTGSIDVGTYYMSSKICSYTRSILERGIEGGYDYLDALLSSENGTSIMLMKNCGFFSFTRPRISKCSCPRCIIWHVSDESSASR